MMDGRVTEPQGRTTVTKLLRVATIAWASLADSNPFNGSWLDVRVKPVFSLVYVNGKYVGTAEPFTKPFRPLRVGVGPQRVEFRAPGYRTVSFWLNPDTGKVATATGTLIKNPD
jgi:hypothetical protein